MCLQSHQKLMAKYLCIEAAFAAYLFCNNFVKYFIVVAIMLAKITVLQTRHS